MTDSQVNDGRVRRIGVPEPVDSFEQTEPSSYAVNDSRVLSSTTVEGGNVRKMDDWQPPEPVYTGGASFSDAAPVPRSVTPSALNVPIIAIHGDYGSGKSTLAKMLVTAYGGAVLPLADALRASLVRAGIPREKVYEKPTSPEMRELLESHAKLMTKLMGDDFFSAQWLEGAYELQRNAPGAPIIVDDLRRPAELRMLWEAGAFIISFASTPESPDPMQEALTHIERSVIEVAGMLHAQAMRLRESSGSRIAFRAPKQSPLPGLVNVYTSRQYLTRLDLTAYTEGYMQDRNYTGSLLDRDEPEGQNKELI
jgi:hypothetical protein